MTHLRDKAREKAMKIVGRFISRISSPMRLKRDGLQFILDIKNIQRKWKKHLDFKKDARKKVNDQW